MKISEQKTSVREKIKQRKRREERKTSAIYFMGIFSFVFASIIIGYSIDVVNTTSIENIVCRRYIKAYEQQKWYDKTFIEEWEYKYDWPIHPDDYIKITSAFGIRDVKKTYNVGGGFRNHKGIDLKGTHEARLKNLNYDGVVTDHYLSRGWHEGKFYSGDGPLGESITILYEDGWTAKWGHCSEVYFKEEDFVSAGEVIGRQGNTGVTTGPHLHFELRDENGFLVNPFRYIKEPGE